MHNHQTTGALSNFTPWTSREDATLRTTYAAGGIKAAERALPSRSKAALFHRAQRLGLKRRLRWTPDDDARLTKLWGTMTLRKIAKTISRTEITTYWRAQKIGLQLGCQQGHEYLLHAAKRTGYCSKQLREILKAGGVKLHRSMARPNDGATRFHTIDPIDVDDAVAKWLASEVVTAAARARGIVGETLHHWLLAARVRGVAVPDQPAQAKCRWRVPTAVIDEVVAWQNARESLAAAALRVGVGRSRLTAWVNAAGLPKGPSRPWLLEKAAIDRLVAERRGKAAA